MHYVELVHVAHGDIQLSHDWVYESA